MTLNAIITWPTAAISEWHLNISYTALLDCHQYCTSTTAFDTLTGLSYTGLLVCAQYCTSTTAFDTITFLTLVCWSVLNTVQAQQPLTQLPFLHWFAGLCSILYKHYSLRHNYVSYTGLLVCAKYCTSITAFDTITFLTLVCWFVLNTVQALQPLTSSHQPSPVSKMFHLHGLVVSYLPCKQGIWGLILALSCWVLPVT